MLVETQTQLAAEMRHRDLLETLVKHVEAKGAHLPKTKAERLARAAHRLADERLRADIEHSLSQLENGVTWAAGVCFPELEPLVGKPGLRVTRVKVARLEREAAELQTLEAQWAKGTRKFRYVGKPDKFRHDGRFLEPGDEVELGRARAMALRDMFEAVDETVAVG